MEEVRGSIPLSSTDEGPGQPTWAFLVVRGRRPHVHHIAPVEAQWRDVERRPVCARRDLDDAAPAGSGRGATAWRRLRCSGSGHGAQAAMKWREE